MTEAIEGQGRVGEAWAEQWRRTDRTLAPVNDALVARAAVRDEGNPRYRLRRRQALDEIARIAAARLAGGRAVFRAAAWIVTAKVEQS